MTTYLDHYHAHPVRGRAFAVETFCLHSWAEHTAQRLAWTHGQERARQILAGQDAATNADLAAWNTLGRRTAA